MTQSTVPPNDPPKNDPATLDANQLRDVVGDEVDARMEARGLTEERLTKLDLLDSIESTFDGLFAKHTSGNQQLDKDGLLKDISNLIDSKLASLGGNNANDGGNTVGRNRGPLGRFLAGNSS